MEIVIFEDGSEKFGELLDKAADMFLELAAMDIERQARANTAVKSGRTRDAWDTRLDSSRKTAYIGNTLENSVWEEFGTGEYALSGNGRKGGWVYHDGEDFHFTLGKPPKRALFRAFLSEQELIKSAAELIFGEVFK